MDKIAKDPCVRGAVCGCCVFVCWILATKLCVRGCGVVINRCHPKASDAADCTAMCWQARDSSNNVQTWCFTGTNMIGARAFRMIAKVADYGRCLSICAPVAAILSLALPLPWSCLPVFFFVAVIFSGVFLGGCLVSVVFSVSGSASLCRGGCFCFLLPFYCIALTTSGWVWAG